MPTIDQLDPVLAVTDLDEMALSQDGIARKATRAQIVAGYQSQIALAAGQILGRISVGVGAPEAISLGANLSVSNGTLAAYAAPVSLNTLPIGQTPSAGDLVSGAQGGRNVAVSYSEFMAGLAGLTGLDGSALTVLASGARAPRTLADLTGDAVAVESFGARGDGVTDDSAAFAAALSAGAPLRLAAKTYIIDGQFTIATANATLIGVAGHTILKRGAQSSGGAWIAVQSASFRADGIIFDANRAAVTQESWGVLIANTCIASDLRRCNFLNAAGATLGCGLTFQASDPIIVDHVVQDCSFANNAAHGLWVQACAGVVVEGCRAHDNTQYGICIDYNDPTFAQKVRLAQVVDCRAWNNQRGISVGNFNATNTQPPVWGNGNPDANSIVVAGCICHDNAIYGIAVAGQWLSVFANTLSNNGLVGNSGAGILANVASSLVQSNMITGGALFGIDCGGSIASELFNNFVDGAVFGINCGGSERVRVNGNSVQNCSEWAIVANNVEADGQGQTFGIACSGLSITGNTISLRGNAASGVLLRDGPQNVVVAGNSFVSSGGALIGNCLWASTDSVVIRDNTWNGADRMTINPIALNGLQTLIVPDIVDTLMITAPAGPIQSIMSGYGVIVSGGIAFVRVTSGGQGYTNATVSIGGPGSGAIATAILSGGAVIGVAVTAAGSGYGNAGAMVPVAVTGNGTGAQANAYAGLPLPEQRRLQMRCNSAVVFARAASMPYQENAGQTDLTVPAFGDVDWVATFGQWRAVRVTPSLLAGCLGATGHGSPEGVVTAPPGSDYRNLDGGAGSTLWVKRTGSQSTGWFAVA